MVFGLWICGPFPNVFRCFEQSFGSKRGAMKTEQMRDANQPNEETQMKTSGSIISSIIQAQHFLVRLFGGFFWFANNIIG